MSQKWTQLPFREAQTQRTYFGQLHAIDLPYRLTSGTLDTPENAAIWVDSLGLVCAWAIFQPVFWTIDVGGDSGVLPNILRWTEQRAQKLGRSCWFIEALDSDTEKLATLEAAGYLSQTEVSTNPWFKLRMMRSCSRQNIAPPIGYRIRSLNGVHEVDAYVALHRHAFESEAMTTQWRNAILKHPAYHPELDLVAEDSEGQLVGFCIGWFAAGFGHLEPMGVHKNHRRYGLGTALIAELLRRLEGLGATHCLVEPECGPSPAVALYETMGFRIEQRIHLCRRDFPKVK